MDDVQHSIFNGLGIYSESLISWLTTGATLVIVGLLGWLAYLIAKKWLARLVIHLAGKTSTHWDDLMFDQKFFNRLALLIMPIVIRVAAATIEWKHAEVLSDLIDTWIIIAGLMLISAVLGGVNRIYESYVVSKDRPIKVFIQVVMIFLWCAALMFIFNLFTGRDVTVMLGGLTAFAAILMLVFQDSILGFVAGIQLSANNMVRIGDWIVVPSRGADGEVIEISLTTVKVQNWDKTITTIPTHKLVSESFTNWRGMEESKGRRIKRSVYIDIASVHYLSESEIDEMERSALLKGYMEEKIRELRAYNESRRNPLDERRMTNLGTFREYLEQWMAHNPAINLDMTHMVRQLQSGPTGVPLEIYCFSARQKWIEYERVQSDIFDHVFAVMGLFGLRPFQYSGAVADTPS